MSACWKRRIEADRFFLVCLVALLGVLAWVLVVNGPRLLQAAMSAFFGRG